jgi:hypothetical protein
VRPTEPLPVVHYDELGDTTEDDGPAELPRLYTDIAGGSAPMPQAAPVVPSPAAPSTPVTGTQPEETTRRVLYSDLARAAAASVPRVDAPPGAPSTAPVLSKKGAGPSGGFAAVSAYGNVKESSNALPTWEEEDTGVVAPTLEAELLLKQGFAARALETYRLIAAERPDDVALHRRVAEIEALIAAERSPMAGDVTVRRDVSDLQRVARPTGARMSVPDEVRAAVAAFGNAAVPGTLDAPGLPQGQFDDDGPTSVVVARRSPVAPVASPAAAGTRGAPSIDLSVSITRIVVVR